MGPFKETEGVRGDIGAISSRGTQALSNHEPTLLSSCTFPNWFHGCDGTGTPIPGTKFDALQTLPCHAQAPSGI